MELKYDTLPQAAKAIILEYGDKVVSDITFLNIISDCFEIDSLPGAKNILRKCLSDGYGNEILLISSSEIWEIKSKMICSKFSSENGTRHDLTQYIIDSIFYGLGKIEKEPEYRTEFVNHSKTMVDLEVELRKLKGEFLTYIDDNVMASDDSPAYFLTNDKSDIFVYKEKINILNSALGTSDRTWCDERMNEVIIKNSPTKPKAEKKKGFFQRLFG